MARTTRAVNAVERLKTRSGNSHYAAVGMPGGLFYLVDRTAGAGHPLCDPLALDAFVAFVDAYGPQQKVRKASKLDLAFEEQIRKSRK